MKKFEDGQPDAAEETHSAFTPQGNMVLQMVQEKVHSKGRENLAKLIEANDKIRSKLIK